MWPWEEQIYRQRRLIALVCTCVVILAIFYLGTNDSITDDGRVIDPTTTTEQD